MTKRSFLKCLLFVLSTSGWQWAAAQSRMRSIPDSLLRQMETATQIPRVLAANPQLVWRGDSLWVVSGICKPLLWRKYDEVKMKPVAMYQVGATKPPPLISIHGNVQYDFLHRSYVDTPFAQHDFQQHTIQASLRVVIKDKYPLKMNLSNRISNSPYFRNFLDLGWQLDQYNYVNNYKKQLLDKSAEYFDKSPDLQAMEMVLKEKLDRVQQLRASLAQPDVFQRIVGEREKHYLEKLKTGAGLQPGSSVEGGDLQALTERVTHKARPGLQKKYTLDEDGSFSGFIDQKKNELDSLQRDLARFQRKTDSARNEIKKKVQDLRKNIYQAKNRSELKKIARENDWAMSNENGFDRFLSNVRSVGIGRSMVSYSELTVWNVALTGLNMEYNDSKIYAAIAGGKMDYGVRDFLGNNSRAKRQSMLMGRLGLGDKDDKAIILSVFTGKKYSYGIVQADSVSNYVNVTGYSLEAIWKKDAYTSFSAEVAKTTRPVTGSVADGNRFADLFDLGDKRNLGASIKGQTRLAKTDTRIEGFLRKTGEQFQSFSLFTYNTDQLAWQLKVDQPLWRKRLSLIGSLRRNDFTNPFADKTYKTSTIFSSVQVSLRMPRLPVLSVGYFPGTQLFIEGKERVLENVYYMLNASAVYEYEVAGGHMISSTIYNRYSGKGTDSGFVAYSGSNYMVSQSFLVSRFQLNGMYNFTDQERMRYHTMEAGLDYSVTKNIRISGAGKYNRIINGDCYWGSRMQVVIELPQLGSLQLQYDKSYLPTVYGDLFPVESGRITWLKFF